MLFAVASLGAGFAASGTELILWRILQGIGGSFLFANSAAIVTDAFPREQLGMAMGTNTMVAAIGLVIGPGAGWRAGADLVALGVLVQRPVRARREHLGVAHPARGHRPRGGPLVRRARDDHVSDRADRARVRHLQGRHLGLEQLVGGREPDRRGGISPRLRADREPRQVADARPLDLQEPPVLGGVRRRVHERAGAIRADVRVRLLLPGRSGQLADPRRDQARAAGDRDADRLAAGRHLGRSARLARDGRGRDARPGRAGSR